MKEQTKDPIPCACRVRNEHECINPLDCSRHIPLRKPNEVYTIVDLEQTSDTSKRENALREYES
jgi:hypothetical protein